MQGTPTVYEKASRILIAALIVFIAGAQIAFAGDPIEGIIRLSISPAATVWRIDAPEVDEYSTDYHFITFAPGDQVSVFAAGCVQRGGKGLTWARYVDPVGENSNKLYHGLISIPGVTNGLVRLQNFGLDTWHAIGQSSFLTLGYEDSPSAYGDNGYYSHDNGLDNQCLNSHNAFVIIAVAHGGAKSNPASSFENTAPVLSRSMITERVSPRHFTTFAQDQAGLQIFEASGVMCVAHGTACENNLNVGANGKDHIFPNGFPVGVSLQTHQFKVFWPNKYFTQTYNGVSGFDKLGSYGVDDSTNQPPPETVHWQTSCLFAGVNATYQVSYILKHPDNVFINGAGGDASSPMPDICPAKFIPHSDVRP